MSDKTTSTVAEMVLSIMQHTSANIGGVALQATANVNARQIRAAIAELRRTGKLIVGNWSGYHLARNPTEAYECITALRKQARAVNEVADLMEMATAIIFEG